MWWIKPDSENQDRGGFQNRDVGKTTYLGDFGPDYGTDYARFSDPPNFSEDHELLCIIKKIYPNIDISVRNGFVILKGQVQDEKSRMELIKNIQAIPRVKEVINQLSLNS